MTLVFNRQWLHAHGYKMTVTSALDVVITSIDHDMSLHYNVERTISKHCPDLHRDLIGALTYKAVNDISIQQFVAKLRTMDEKTMADTLDDASSNELDPS